MDLMKRKDYSKPQIELINLDSDDMITTSLPPDEMKPRFSTSGDADQKDIYNVYP